MSEVQVSYFPVWVMCAWQLQERRQDRRQERRQDRRQDRRQEKRQERRQEAVLTLDTLMKAAWPAGAPLGSVCQNYPHATLQESKRAPGLQEGPPACYSLPAGGTSDGPRSWSSLLMRTWPPHREVSRVCWRGQKSSVPKGLESTESNLQPITLWTAGGRA